MVAAGSNPYDRKSAGIAGTALPNVAAGPQPTPDLRAQIVAAVNMHGALQCIVSPESVLPEF
jgi:hypothetical protein